jgi:hypothetical protein
MISRLQREGSGKRGEKLTGIVLFNGRMEGTLALRRRKK